MNHSKGLLRTLGLVILIQVLVVSVGLLGAQEKPKGYPSRQIEIIVPYGAGGGTDIFVRTIGIPMRRYLKVPLVINNMSGAAGAVGTAYVCKQPPDGYTLLAISTDLVITDAFKRSPYTRHDLVPIARVQHDQSVLWVRAESPFKSIQDVVKDAKANPGKQKWGITSPAGFDEVLVSSFAKEAGIKITTVPFNAAPETHAALLGGHVDVMHEEPGSVIGLYEAGKLRPLVIMTEKRLSKFKDVPTAKEIGADVKIGIWRGFFAKKGTSPKIVRYLEAIVKKAMDHSVYKAVTAKRVLDQRVGFMSGEDFASFLEKEYELYKNTLKELGHIK